MAVALISSETIVLDLGFLWLPPCIHAHLFANCPCFLPRPCLGKFSNIHPSMDVTSSPMMTVGGRGLAWEWAARPAAEAHG